MAANINTECLLVFECFSTVCRAEASEAFKTDRNMMEDDDAWRFLFCFVFLDWLNDGGAREKYSLAVYPACNAPPGTEV